MSTLLGQGGQVKSIEILSVFIVFFKLSRDIVFAFQILKNKTVGWHQCKQSATKAG